MTSKQVCHTDHQKSWLASPNKDLCVSLQFQSQVENPLAVQEVGLVGCIGLHSLSLLSSSFVEEEHQTWYFFTSTLHALLLLYPIASLTVWYGLPRVSESTRTAQQYLGDSISGSNSCQNSGSSSSGSFTRIRNRVRSEEVHLIYCQEKKRDTAQPQELSGEQCVKMVVSLVGILLLFRILRRWNQTGNKWLDIPDVGDWLCRWVCQPFFFLCYFFQGITLILLLFLYVGQLGGWSRESRTLHK